MVKVNRANQLHGRLTVLSLLYETSFDTYWQCKCQCGKEIIIRESAFQNKAGVSSCGCLKLLKATPAKVLQPVVTLESADAVLPSIEKGITTSKSIPKSIRLRALLWYILFVSLVGFYAVFRLSTEDKISEPAAKPTEEIRKTILPNNNSSRKK